METSLVLLHIEILLVELFQTNHLQGPIMIEATILRRIIIDTIITVTTIIIDIAVTLIVIVGITQMGTLDTKNK